MAFLGKLGNVLEDAASFAVPAGLFALGTFAGGGNPLAGKALMGAAASGAGGFARNEEEERIRKAQEEARRSSAVANLMNAISPGTGARGAAPVMPKAGLMETVARGGAQGYDFYKKAEMAANAAKEMKNRLAQQERERLQQEGRDAFLAARAEEPTTYIEGTSVSPLAPPPGASADPVQIGPTAGKVTAPIMPPAGMPASFKSVVGGQSPAGDAPGRLRSVTGAGVAPIAIPPGADALPAGGPPMAVGPDAPYEQRIGPPPVTEEAFLNRFDPDAQPIRHAAFEQARYNWQAEQDVSGRADERLKIAQDTYELADEKFKWEKERAGAVTARTEATRLAARRKLVEAEINRAVDRVSKEEMKPEAALSFFRSAMKRQFGEGTEEDYASFFGQLQDSVPRIKLGNEHVLYISKRAAIEDGLQAIREGVLKLDEEQFGAFKSLYEQTKAKFLTGRWTDEAARDVMNMLDIQSEMGVRLLSGAAITESEFDRFSGEFLGGLDQGRDNLLQRLDNLETAFRGQRESVVRVAADAFSAAGKEAIEDEKLFELIRLEGNTGSETMMDELIRRDSQSPNLNYLERYEKFLGLSFQEPSLLQLPRGGGIMQGLGQSGVMPYA